jgi:hypothetical protein
MNNKHVFYHPRCGVALLALLMAAGLAHAEEPSFHLGGYLRMGASFNLQDAPETAGDDRGKLSMLRGTLLLDADADAGPLRIKGVARAVREHQTGYLKDLEQRVEATTPGGPGSDMMDYLYNEAELRELHVEFEPTDRILVRLGKQQVVWGETDFFRAMDVVHGFDYRWRAFLEPENEELRKPLILANMTVQVPEVHGALQLLFRPGWDRKEDIGNTVDLAGGRWRPQPYRGSDTLSATHYDARHPSGDVRDKTWGMRWSGRGGAINYSFAYLKTFNPDPVLNSAFVPYKKTPTGALGDWINPANDVYGVTVSGYLQSIDAVLSTELVYTKGAAFNVGSQSMWPGVLPEGLGGIVRRNTFTSMFRMDKNLDLRDVIGTSKQSMFSVQLFNTRILDFDKDDDIVMNVGYSTLKKRDSALLTALLGMSFDGDRINPQIAAGWDVSYGGAFVIPSVDVVMGDAWRLKVEADLFYGGKPRHPGDLDSSTSTMGYFHDNNQLYVRLTRQF